MLASETSIVSLSGVSEQQQNPHQQACPNCGVTLDVQDQEPLSSVTCPECQTRFKIASELLHFRLESLLGQGGMGTVFKAYDNSLGRHVALKLLRSDYTANAEYLERLNNEASIMAQLSHPNVVRVFSIGEDRGQFFLAMELIEHGTLDDVLQNQSQLAEVQALDIGIQAAKGLKAAYEAGVLHRDVKPGNILFVNRQTVKITDFGLSELTDSKTSESDEIIGTPYYIPPERLNREPEDCRSDIYSLGATLFHTIAGRPPFEASDATAVALKHLKAQPVSLATYAPHVSGPTAYVINRTLLKDPNQRYQSYTEFIEHLEYARNELVSATGKPQARARVVLEDEGQQKLWAWASLGMLAVVALGAAAFLIFRKGPDSTIPASAKSGQAIAAEIANATVGEAGSFESASDLLARGQFEKAAETFRKLADSSPATGSVRPKALLYTGVSELFASRPDQANAAFRELGSQKIGAGPDSERLSAFFTNLASLSETDAKGLPAFADRFDKSTYEALGLLILGLQSWHAGEVEQAASMLRAYRSAESAIRGTDWYVELRGPVTSFLGQTASYQLLVERTKSKSPNDWIAVLPELQAVEGPYASHARKLSASLEAEINELRKKYATYPKSGAYRLVNRKTGKAMEVAGGSKDNDARVEQGTPDAEKAHQEWVFWPLGFGVYRLEARHTGKMLDLFNNKADDGTFIGQWNLSEGLPQQRWKLERHEDGSFSVIAEGTGKVLSVRGESEIVQLTDKGDPENRWTIESLTPAPAILPAGVYMIVNAHSGHVIDVHHRKKEDGTKLLQWSSDNGGHQRFRMTPLDNEYYKIEAVHSGKVMDVRDRSTADGSLVHQWSWRNQTNQKWKIIHQGEAGYRISPMHAPDTVLSVRDQSTAKGGEIIITKAQGAPEEFWIMVPDRAK